MPAYIWAVRSEVSWGQAERGRALPSRCACPQALKGLASRLREIQEYMELVLEGRLPINQDIMTYFQDIFNLLPNMNVESLASSLAGGGGRSPWAGWSRGGRGRGVRLWAGLRGRGSAGGRPSTCSPLC